MHTKSSQLVQSLFIFMLLLSASPPQSFAHSDSSTSGPAHTGHTVKQKTKLGHTKFNRIKFGHLPGSHNFVAPPPQGPPPQGPPAQGPVTYIYPETYGAKADGQTDDFAAIQKAIAVAQTIQNAKVAFGLGAYDCSGQLTVNGTGLVGNNSSINFTNANSLGVVLTGQSASIVGIALTFEGGGPNPPMQPNPAIPALAITNASNFAVNSVSAKGFGGDSVDCLASGSGVISNCLLEPCPTSSLMIRDSNNVTVSSNTLANIEVLSGNTISNGLVITNNNIGTNTGQQLTYFTKLAGLSNSSFTNNTITNGALYLGTSVLAPTNPGYSDGSVYNVYVANNLIDGLHATSLADTLGIVVNSYGAGGNTVDTVSLVSNTIQNLSISPSGIYLGSGVSNVNVMSNTLNYIGTYNCSAILTSTVNNINIQGNSITKTSLIGINCTPTYGSGSISIVNNSISNACSYAAGNRPLIIEIATGPVTPLSLTVTGNYYGGPANNALAYIECDVPSSATKRTISGNTQATALPNNIAP